MLVTLKKMALMKISLKQHQANDDFPFCIFIHPTFFPLPLVSNTMHHYWSLLLVLKYSSEQSSCPYNVDIGSQQNIEKFSPK